VQKRHLFDSRGKKERMWRSQGCEVLPGLEISFSQPIRDNVLERISQVDGQIVVKTKGDDLGEIGKLANRIVDLARGTQAVVRAFIDRAGQLPQVRIDIDREAAARFATSATSRTSSKPHWPARRQPSCGKASDTFR